MIRRLALPAAVALCAACASAPTPRGESAAGEKPAQTQTASAAVNAADARRQLLAALERELEPLPQQKVTAKDERFTGSAEASGAITVEEAEEFSNIGIPLGTGSEISCFVYRDSIDAAVSLQRIVAALAENVTLEALRPVEISAAADRAAVFLEMDYTTDTEDGRKAAGQVKLMAAPDDDLPVICLHDELGYRRTFRRVAQAFAASIEPRGAIPRFAEIHIFRVNDLPVGFEQRRIWDVEQGQTVVENTSVLVMPRSKKELVFQDTSSTQVSDANLRVTQYSYARARDGELMIHATLERQKGNTYAAKGTHHGKEFSASFSSKDRKGLLSEVAIQRQVKERLLSGKTQELQFETYTPAELPDALKTIAYRRSGEGARAVTLVNGELQAQGELDEHGVVERVQMPVGPNATMTMERAVAQGTP